METADFRRCRGRVRLNGRLCLQPFFEGEIALRKQSMMARFIGQQTRSALTPEDLSARRSAAEAELKEAERLHGQAALEVERGVPGSIAAKAEAAGALRLAQERLRDVTSAQLEYEAECRDRERRQRKAAEAATDAQHEATVARFEAVAEKVAPAVEAYVRLSNELAEAFKPVFDMAPSIGCRQPIWNMETAIQQEIARHGSIGYAPGSARSRQDVISNAYDPAKIVPLVIEARSLGASLRRQLADRTAKRAKRT